MDDDRMGHDELEERRRTRRHPKRSLWDYLHLARLRDDLAAAVRALPPGGTDALDIFCGSRPYDDLLPPGMSCVGMDIDDSYGVADVVSTEFLPFEDRSFDLVTCIGAFFYLEDSERGMAEIRRVLRPGGTVIISVPLVYEYSRENFERRFTGTELERLFQGWDDTRIVENGGRAVSWTTLTGRLVHLFLRSRSARAQHRLAPFAALGYRALNRLGGRLERMEERFAADSLTLPVNVMLIARRPADG